MKVKRNDVAKAAGVSGATVSYVLNGTKRVSPEVEKRVLEAAKELNYVPNRIAQTLVGRRSNSIAIMTNDITNVYQVEVIKGLQEAALANDYIVYVFDAFGNIDKYLQHIVSRQVDGLFVVAAPDALPQDIGDLAVFRLALFPTLFQNRRPLLRLTWCSRPESNW